MNGVNMILVIIMLTITAVEGDGSVSFWRRSVTLVCPDNEQVMKGEEKTVVVDGYMDFNTIEKQEIPEDKRKYYCKIANGNTYRFYIKGKVCENCFELDVLVVAMIFLGDLLVTLGVVLIVYNWVQKRSGEAAASKPAKPTSRDRNRDRAPPVPATDYEQLNPATRNAGIYSDVHRTG